MFFGGPQTFLVASVETCSAPGLIVAVCIFAEEHSAPRLVMTFRRLEKGLTVIMGLVSPMYVVKHGNLVLALKQTIFVFKTSCNFKIPLYAFRNSHCSIECKNNFLSCWSTHMSYTSNLSLTRFTKNLSFDD